MQTLIILALIFLAIRTISFFWNRSNILFVPPSDLLEIGKLLYRDHVNDFEIFVKLYTHDRLKFLEENRDVMEDHSFDTEHLKPVEALYIFGDLKNLLFTTDWRGEENETEIEDYLTKTNSQQNISWAHTTKFRNENMNIDGRDGKFIIDLLQKIDDDLMLINQKLIFINLGWDAFVYTATDQKSYNRIMNISPDNFHGVDKLKKQYGRRNT